MSVKLNRNAAGHHLMERQLIRVDDLPDQAGIAAALRRAFETRPVSACLENDDDDDDDPFAVLLGQIH